MPLKKQLPNLRLDKPQVPFFKYSVLPDRDSNPAYQHLWRSIYPLAP